MANGRAPVDYIEIFYEHLPFYLSIGMTEREFWNCSPCTYRAYREAYKMRIKHENRNLWLQGLYIYHALCDVSPILHAFAKRGTSPIEYLKEPIALTKSEYKEKKEREEKAKYEAMIASMKAWANEHNQRLIRQKEVSDSGRGNG